LHVSRTLHLSRRSLLHFGAFGAVSLALRGAARAEAAPERALSFVHMHTGESARVVYWADGAYLPDGRAEIDRLLRDHYSGDVHPIDAALLDLLHRLSGRLETKQPYQVISGYRSPATNARLAAHSDGVAAHSLHMVGQAIDVRVPGRSLSALRDTALALRAGGVGYYAASDFVHVDVGRVRRW
jgi:uncharacterized protein YcbK (DUF882 family)